jgi:hypothetical protein
MLDERTQQFLDNIIKGKSNEELFQIERNPASVQVEPVTTVEGAAKMRPLEFTQPMQSKQTGDYSENVNRALESAESLKREFALERQMEAEKRVEYEAGVRGAFQKMAEAEKPRVRTLDEIQRIKAANDSLSNIQKAPERDLLSEAIISFSPALTGIIGGESAAISQLEGGKQARNLYEAKRKQDIESIKESNDNILKNYENISKIDKQSAENYLNNQKLLLEQAKAELQGATNLAGKSDAQIRALDQQIAGLEKFGALETTKAAGTAAKFEAEPEKERQKNQRAATLAANKPPSEGERKGAFQLGLMQQAEQNINDIVKKSGGFPSLNEKFFRVKREITAGGYGGTAMSDFLNSDIIDKPTRSQIQAELQFLESIGRIQSGAAISAGEWLNMREQYFPTYGDGDDSIAIKNQQRKQAVQGLKAIAGRATKDVPAAVSVIKGEAPTQSTFTPDKAKRLEELRKKRDAGKLGK